MAAQDIVQVIADAITDAQAFEKFVNGAADLGGDGTFTDRLGTLHKTIAAYEALFDQYGDEFAQAVLDATGLTLPALEAIRDQVVQSANTVATSEANAVAAAASAAVTDNIKPDTATGIAQTTSGQYFSVISPSDSGFIDLYLNDSGTADYQDTYPNQNAFNTQFDQPTDYVQFNFSDLAQKSVIAETKWKHFIVNKVFETGGYLQKIDIVASADGIASLNLYKNDGSNRQFVGYSKTINLVAGIQTITINKEIPAGWQVGCSSEFGIIARVDGENSLQGSIVAGEREDLLTVLTTVGGTIGAAVSYYIAENSENRSNYVIDKGLDFSVKHGSVEEPTVFFIGSNGQSNSQGSNTPATVHQFYGGLSFENQETTLVPANSPEFGNSENATIGFIKSLREKIIYNSGIAFNTALKNNFIGGHSGAGGQPISSFPPYSANYRLSGSQTRSAIKYAIDNNIPFFHLGQIWAQGEANIAGGTDRAVYKPALDTIVTTFNSDIRLVLNVSDNRLFPTWIAQTNSRVDGATAQDMFDIAAAQADSHKTNPASFLACSTYWADYRDFQHYSALGQQQIGAVIADLAYEFAKSGSTAKPQPMIAIDTRVEGSDIIITYSRKAVIDTAKIPAQTQNGFRVYNAGGTEVTATVSVSGQEVTLTPSEQPASGFKWEYGNNTLTGVSPLRGGGGNIRSEYVAGHVNGEDLHHWAVIEDGVVA